MLQLHPLHTDLLSRARARDVVGQRRARELADHLGDGPYILLLIGQVLHGAAQVGHVAARALAAAAAAADVCGVHVGLRDEEVALRGA